MQRRILKKIENLLKVSLTFLMLSFIVYGTAFANHNTLHVGECPEGQVEIPNGTCGPSTTLLIPSLTEPTPIDGDYTLLQKIGDFEKFTTTDECALVKYMNALIKIFIGISAVLAMIMIIAGGIQYMTTDSVSHHKEGVSKLQNALLGLLIALGAWIILNTINPNLLNFCLDKQLPGAVITLEDEYEPTPGDSGGQDSGFAPTGPVGRCKEGIVQLTSSGGSFFSCRTIAYSVLLMMENAWNNKDDKGNPDPIKLSLWGFRTRERQIELRIAHCGGSSHYSIYERSSRDCNPPTARPGASRHEVGLAFDISCEGKTIKSRDNKCFRWLSANAYKYKLFNLPVEPWHWSVDGK